VLLQFASFIIVKLFIVRLDWRRRDCKVSLECLSGTISLSPPFNHGRALLLQLPHNPLKVFSQSDALDSIRLVFDKHLVDLSHLNTTFDRVDFDVSLLQLLSLLPNRTLVAVNQLMSLGVLLVLNGCSTGGVHCLLGLTSPIQVKN
jgi:hypothetical protein